MLASRLSIALLLIPLLGFADEMPAGGLYKGTVTFVTVISGAAALDPKIEHRETHKATARIDQYGFVRVAHAGPVPPYVGWLQFEPSGALSFMNSDERVTRVAKSTRTRVELQISKFPTTYPIPGDITFDAESYTLISLTRIGK